MRNVMVRCTLSALIFALLQFLPVFSQVQNEFLWSGQQDTSDEWHPFVPSNYETPNKPLQNYPHTETIRQYFGKTQFNQLQPNVLKKSFQASAAPTNIVDQFSIPPVISAYNSYPLQGLQTRNSLFDKNIKDSHLLEQPSNYQFKYQPHHHHHHQQQQQQQSQLSSTVHRFPAYLPVAVVEHFQDQSLSAPFHQSQLPLQHQSQSNYQSNSPSGYISRYENSVRPSLMQSSGSRTPMATSVQIYPPPPHSTTHNQYPSNNLFIGTVPTKDDYVKVDSLDHKQAHPNYLPNSVYHNREPNPVPNLHSSPTNQKNIHSSRPEPQHNFYYDNVRPPSADRYEFENFNLQKGPPAHSSLPTFPTAFGNEHIRGNGAVFLLKQNLDPKKAENVNPSKQVFEQLSHLGRPFTLSREPQLSEYNHKSKDTEPVSLSSYSTRGRPPAPPSSSSQYKKSKPTTPAPITYHRLPGANVIDYEAGKLQSVRTVTYEPQRDMIQFNEEDVSALYPVASEKLPTASNKNSFLPTPTNTNKQLHNVGENGATFSYFEPFTLTAVTESLALDNASKLPYNHKYHQTRGRQPIEHIPMTPTDDSKLQNNNADEAFEPTSEVITTTKKLNLRRRKPSKVKSKPQTPIRSRVTTQAADEYTASSTDIYMPSHTQGDSTTLGPRGNYYSTEANENSDPSESPFSNVESQTVHPDTTTTAYINRKKSTKVKTTSAVLDDNYPNYPLEYLKKLNNYSLQGPQYSNTNPSNSDDTKISKASYPMRPKFKYSTTLVSVDVTEPITTTSPTTTNSASNRVNTLRPRFSIKDYKRTSTPSPSESAISSNSEDGETVLEAERKKNQRKQLFAIRSRNRTETTTDDEGVVNDKESPLVRKYRPGIRPSRFKSSTGTSSSTSVNVDTTSERVNTFRPSSAGKTKSTTNKYFNKYRSTTEVSNNVLSSNSNSESDRRLDVQSKASDTATAFSDNKPSKTMIFSAKKPAAVDVEVSNTIPISQKEIEYEDEEDENYEDNSDEELMLDTIEDDEKMKKNLKPHSIVKVIRKVPISQTGTAKEKADDATQTRIMTSAEEEVKIEAVEGKNTTQEGENLKSTTTSSIMSTIMTTTASTTFENILQVGSLEDMSLDDLHKESQQDYQDDVNDRVSKVSSLTSQDDSSHIHGTNSANYKHWRFPMHSSGRVETAIKTTSDY